MHTVKHTTHYLLVYWTQLCTNEQDWMEWQRKLNLPPPSDGRVCARHCPMLWASMGATAMIDRRIKAADFTDPLLQMSRKKQEFFSPTTMKLVRIRIFFLFYISLSFSHSQRRTWRSSRGDSMLYSARNRLRYLKRGKSVKNWERIQQNCDLGWKPGEGNKKHQSAGKIMRIGKVCVCNSASKSNKNRHLGYNHYQWITLVVFSQMG